METIPLSTAIAGDLVFCYNTSLVGRAIRLAERLRWRSGSSYNHVAILDNKTAGSWTLIEAVGRGVTRGSPLTSSDRKNGYVIVPLPEGTCREDVLAFARAQVGTKYGYLTLVSILVTLFSPKFVNVMLPNTWICSALAGESLRCGGWIHTFGDIYQVSPAELSEAL